MSTADPPGPNAAVTGAGAMAVSPHRLASEAAVDVMKAGGTAVDGAIAANAVLAVVLPSTCGPGGDLFALVHRPGSTAPAALNASGRAGSGTDAASLRSDGHTEMPLYGPWGITAPGCVAGWEALLERFGTCSMADVLQPAIEAAAGFPASAELSGALARGQARIGREPSAAALYPGGRPPEAGETLSRSDLARTLTDLAAGGRDAFYGGAVGRGIVAATGGRVTMSDLEAVAVEWVEPLSLEVFGRTGWTVPPNSQGYLVLATARVFTELAPPPDPEDPAYVHAAIEAYRSVAWERDLVLADPDHMALAAADLLSEPRLVARAARIGPDRFAPWPTPGRRDGGTAYLCAVDSDGMGVSLIQSNFHGIGSGLGAGDTGVFLHNRGAGFSLVPGHPNELSPGKRPLHTLSPTLWTEGRRLDMLLGTRGGHQQPQLLAQASAHLWHARLAPAAAQAVPRWTMDDFGPDTASSVRVEARMPDATVRGLRARGHQVEVSTEPWIGGWGPISMIGIAADGTRTGAADPRISSAASVAS